MKIISKEEVLLKPRLKSLGEVKTIKLQVYYRDEFYNCIFYPRILGENFSWEIRQKDLVGKIIFTELENELNAQLVELVDITALETVVERRKSSSLLLGTQKKM